jgi:hypothetical protein
MKSVCRSGIAYIHSRDIEDEEGRALSIEFVRPEYVLLCYNKETALWCVRSMALSD